MDMSMYRAPLVRVPRRARYVVEHQNNSTIHQDAMPGSPPILSILHSGPFPPSTNESLAYLDGGRSPEYTQLPSIQQLPFLADDRPDHDVQIDASSHQGSIWCDHTFQPLPSLPCATLPPYSSLRPPRLASRQRAPIACNYCRRRKVRWPPTCQARLAVLTT